MRLHERGRSPGFTFTFSVVSFTFAPSMWLFVVCFSDVCLHDVAHVTCCISLYLVACPGWLWLTGSSSCTPLSLWLHVLLYVRVYFLHSYELVVIDGDLRYLIDIDWRQLPPRHDCGCFDFWMCVILCCTFFVFPSFQLLFLDC